MRDEFIHLPHTNRAEEQGRPKHDGRAIAEQAPRDFSTEIIKRAIDHML